MAETQKRKRLADISANPKQVITISSDEDEPKSKRVAKALPPNPVPNSTKTWQYEPGPRELYKRALFIPAQKKKPRTVEAAKPNKESKVRRHGKEPKRSQDGLKSTPTGYMHDAFLPKEAPGTPPKSSDKSSSATEPELCEEQRALVDLILSGRNVFYTGSAGCGKSTVLKAFVKELKDRGKTVNIIAPTGRAALDINGSTFWTYAGWTPLHMKRELKKLKEAAHGKFVRKRLRETDVLVIDEISMVENHHFERLNVIMKEARGDPERAFGGVQLVVTGDFCQLPPVKPFAYCMQCGRELQKRMEGAIYKCPQHGEFLDNDKWAFRSVAWNEAKFSHVCLRTIHRQKDRKFIEILEKCRMGKVLKEQDTKTLLDHNTDFDTAVKLFSTREEVRRINQSEFDKLATDKRVFHSSDTFKPSKECDPFTAQKFSKPTEDGSLHELRDHRFDSIIELKEGMQVVLLVNLDLNTGLVNGSQGQIIGWEPFDPASQPKSRTSLMGKERKEYEAGLPAKFPVLTGDYSAHREENIKTFIQEASVKEWPIVRFDNGLMRTIIADCTVNEIGEREPWSLLSRTQIPLLAAWAMSIHKSQGMTLTKVIVDLGRSFEEGQMYVALSRARSLNGLRVDNLGRWRAKGNPQVMKFLKEKFQIE